VDPKKAVQLEVVLFYSDKLKNGVSKVYDRIQNFVNGFNAPYRVGEKPFAMIPVQTERNWKENDRRHWGAVEKYFSEKAPQNVFVLDFVKPNSGLDAAYPVVKRMLGKSGYLSQFVNFKTYSHDNPRDERKSNMTLQGVARQILHKAGVS